MRTSVILGSIPLDLEYVWVTHLPNFSIEKFKVTDVLLEKNGEITIKLEDSSIYGDAIKARKHQNGFQLKKSYHITEADAAIRLRDHYRKINAEKQDDTAARVVGDSKDKEQMILNIEKYTEMFPEMTI